MDKVNFFAPSGTILEFPEGYRGRVESYNLQAKQYLIYFGTENSIPVHRTVTEDYIDMNCKVVHVPVDEVKDAEPGPTTTI